ncbi:MAG: hypothetical protein V2I51_12045 [Anderseniella sp.]|nr:hypothetical protein [Anderseniella sp.]
MLLRLLGRIFGLLFSCGGLLLLSGLGLLFLLLFGGGSLLLLNGLCLLFLLLLLSNRSLFLLSGLGLLFLLDRFGRRRLLLLHWLGLLFLLDWFERRRLLLRGGFGLLLFLNRLDCRDRGLLDGLLLLGCAGLRPCSGLSRHHHGESGRTRHQLHLEHCKPFPSELRSFGCPSADNAIEAKLCGYPAAWTAAGLPSPAGCKPACLSAPRSAAG